MSLIARLHAEIEAGGPMRLDRFMALALHDPEHGYYRTGTPLGAEGDFTTAPELSQLFGEMLGVALCARWLDDGRPDHVKLVELGPGRGLLMADLLRAVAAVDGALAAIDLHLIEASPALRAQTAERLQRPITWHDSLDTVPRGRTYLIANEYLDCLPVRQFVRTADGWAERCITRAGDGLAWTTCAADRSGLDLPDDAAEGAIHEVSPARLDLVARLAGRIARDDGLAYIIDYGGTPAPVTGDTLQALQRHAPVDPLRAPGASDLTSHVDFAALRQVVIRQGAQAHGPLAQGPFLQALGIEARARVLYDRIDPLKRQDFRMALHRLIDRRHMGELFKVLAISQPGTPPPPGFEPAPGGDQA